MHINFDIDKNGKNTEAVMAYPFVGKILVERLNGGVILSHLDPIKIRMFDETLIVDAFKFK